MRIRRRPPFSSFPSFATPSPHSLRDPSLHLPPLAPNGRDASASNGGGAKEGKAAPELHPDAHPPKDPHGFAQDPCYRRTPLHPHLPPPPPPPPPPPRLDPYDDETKGRSIRSGRTHLTDVGHGKVQDFGEEEAAAAAAAESEEERGVSLVDAKMGWDDDAQQVNSSMRRIDGSSGASILLEAARQLDAAAATEKRKKGKVEGCDDWGSDEKLKEEEKEKKKKKKKRDEVKARGRRSAGDASSLRSNCTGVDGKDNDVYHNGDGPATVMEEEEEDKGGVAVNNGGGRSNGKKRRSPAVLMEGSRCSRVNGRGWRCCQQTLVGYSLCEHHLGKGRLRSMSSVRGQIGATTRPKKQNSKTPPPAGPEEDDEEKRAVHLEEQQQQEQQQEKNEPLEVEELEGVNSEDKATKKRRKKAGAVKARSISSLLDGVEPSTAQSLISGDYEAMA